MTLSSRFALRGLSLLAMALALTASPQTSRAETFTDDAYCFSGGPGSTSCSIAVGVLDCSVTCNAPFYACCTIGPNCNCVYNAVN